MNLMFSMAATGAVATLILLVVRFVLRRRPASERHAFSIVGFGAILIFPVLLQTLPQWRVLPTDFMPPFVAKSEQVDNSRSRSAASTRPKAIQELPDAIAFDHETSIARKSAAPSTSLAPELSATKNPTTTSEVVAPTAGQGSLFLNLNWSHYLLIAWSVGSIVLLARLVLSFFLLWRLTRSHPLATSGRIREILDALISRHPSSLTVQLRITDQRTMPMTWGFFTPNILLPAIALDWDRDHLESVLLHELEHITRRDIWSSLIVRIACALQWYNPLVWLAARSSFNDAEQACDDGVLQQGVHTTNYAQHLLQTAVHDSTEVRPFAAQAMATVRTGIETRIRAILDSNTTRLPLNRRLFSAVAAGSLILMILAAVLRAAPPETPAIAAEPPDNVEKVSTRKPSETTTAKGFDFTQISRTIAKEPAYETTSPGYCLVVFGPKAEQRVWIVKDGDRIFVDRNGNGDLTEANELVTKIQPGGWFHLGRVKGAGDSKKNLKLWVRKNSTIELEIGSSLYIQRAGVVGTDSLRLAKKPAEAPIIYPDGPVTLTPLAHPVLNLSSEGPRLDRLPLVVGSAGSGQGTFAAMVPIRKVPIRELGDLKILAEFEFPSSKRGAPPIVSRQELAIQINVTFLSAGPVQLPKNARGGRARLKLSISSDEFHATVPTTIDAMILHDTTEPSEIRNAAQETTRAFASAFENEFWGVEHAAQALASFGPAAKEAIPTLQQALIIDDSSARLAIADAIVRISSIDDVVSVLSEHLQMENAEVAENAAATLRDFEPVGKESAPALVKFLNEHRHDGRFMFAHKYTIQALVRIGPTSNDVVPGLIGALDHPSGYLARFAGEALGQLGPSAEPAVPYLLRKLNDSDSKVVQKKLVEALGKIGPGARQALPVLKLLAADRSEDDFDSRELRRHATVAIELIAQ